MIDLNRYTGYLAPILPAIINLHHRGWTHKEIAIRINEELEQGKLTLPSDISEANILYALRRVGIFPKVKNEHYIRQIKRSRAIRAKRYKSWKDAASKPFLPLHKLNKGRPIDMGGPRDLWITKSPWDKF